MKKFEIDARELDCPKPLLRTKQAVSDEEFDELVIRVGNVPARENVCRFLSHQGFTQVNWEEEGPGFRITVKQKEAGFEQAVPSANPDNSAAPRTAADSPQAGGAKTILIGSNCIGTHEEKLGALLMKGYIYTLTQLDKLPAKLVFMNTGVRLCLENSESLEDLKSLEKQGIEILVCGTCLEFLNVREELAVGKISNMYEIAGTLNDANGLVSLT